MLKETNRLSVLLAIAVDALDAELAAVDGDTARALAAARRAAALEDGLERDEPPAWHVPARRTPGALGLAAGRPGDAEPTFRADLARRPANGFTLAGLAAALRAQGRTADAAAVDAERARAFAHADLPLDAARFSARGWARRAGGQALRGRVDRCLVIEPLTASSVAAVGGAGAQDM